jgi:ATP-dependent DNA helicase RecG
VDPGRPPPGIATVEEERRLAERAVAGALTFDRRPCLEASLADLLDDVFRSDYLPRLVDAATLAENRRPLEEQLASARLFDLARRVPTHAGLLLLGRDPLQYLPGAYLQFVRFEGTELSDPIQDEKALTGNLLTQLRQLDTLLPVQIRVARGPEEGLRHGEQPDYRSRRSGSWR